MLKKYTLLPLSFLLLAFEISNSQIIQDAFNRDKKPKQERPDTRIPLNSPADRSLRQPERPHSLLDRQRQGLTELTAQPLEGAIDPETYLVGPGDRFMIDVLSSMEDFFIVTVTPEGRLVIPTMGSLQVYGETLARVKEMVRTAGEKKYLHTQVEANLVELRSIRVHVAGQILYPGSYEAYTVHRVSDVIEVAGGLTSWAYDRELQVRHLDGSTDTVDLYAYKKLGDLSANPFLRGGDVIFVPGIDLNKPSVTVEGLVNDPGSYQIQPGETLKDVLLRVDALSRRTDLEGAYLERSENGETKRIPIFPYLRNMGNGHSQLLLQDGDVLKIGQRLEDVYVIGSVQYPGPYPYVPGLTVRDYIGFGGSMNQAASPKKTKLLRKGSQQEEVGLDVTVGPGDTIFVPKNAEFRVGEIASVLSALATTILVINQIATQ